jgi:hypothetical protein
MPNELSRERQVRKWLARAGCRLLKTPSRSALRRSQPVGYAVLHATTNTHILGDRFSATLDDVERSLGHLTR